MKKILALFFISCLLLCSCGEEKVYIYTEHLDDVCLTVDDTQLTLNDLTFYIIYEEGIIENEAIIYDPDDPSEYWNIHTNDKFVRLLAKEMVVNMAAHDEIYYTMAKKEGIKLTNSEEAIVKDKSSSYYADLTQYQLDNTGLTEETLYNTMYKMAISQKQTELLADKNNAFTKDYEYTGGMYQLEAQHHAIKTNDKNWEEVIMGDISIER